MSWDYVTIGSCVEKTTNWNPKKQSGFFDYIDLSSVDKDLKRITTVEECACAEAPSRAKQIVRAGDVLIATVRPNLNGVALVEAQHNEMTASTGYCVLRPKSDELDSKYLFQWVKTNHFVKNMIDVATGANYPAVSDAKVKDSKIPLPPLSEQKRIASILDSTDALRTKRRQAIAMLDELLQATFLDMFGDPVINEKELKKETLKTVFSFTTGKIDSNKATDDGMYPFFTCSKEIYKTDNFAFEQEALLLAGNNASADYDVKYFNGKFNAYQRTYVISIDKEILNFKYAKFALEFLLVDLKRYSKGSNTKYLTLQILHRMNILIPPLPLQNQFANIVEKVEAQKAVQQAHLAELDTLFASLQQRAFAGDL